MSFFSWGGNTGTASFVMLSKSSKWQLATWRYLYSMICYVGTKMLCTKVQCNGTSLTSGFQCWFYRTSSCTMLFLKCKVATNVISDCLCLRVSLLALSITVILEMSHLHTLSSTHLITTWGSCDLQSLMVHNWKISHITYCKFNSEVSMDRLCFGPKSRC